MQLGMPCTKLWICPGPTQTAILSGETPLSTKISERRLPVSTSMPFMHSTKTFSETGYFMMRCMNPRSPCELMEMTTISARLTANSRSHESVMRSSSVTYSFLPVSLSTR